MTSTNATQRAGSRRVAVLGDIGGHWAEVYGALVGLGMNPETCGLPDDLTVVQVGDLVHRGPDSAEVLALVATILRQQPERWIQLVGNHEGLYLPGAPQFPWHPCLDASDADVLREWWADGRMRVAVGLATEVGDLLVTHAGLTAGLWRRIGCPTDVRQAVPALNVLAADDPAALWRTGRMYDGRAPDRDAGPVWAEAGSEVYASWLAAEGDGEPVPFGQVHGHSSAWSWEKRAWRSGPVSVRSRFVPAAKRRHLLGVIGGRIFAGIDPCFGQRAARWAPLVLSPARVVAR